MKTIKKLNTLLLPTLLGALVSCAAPPLQNTLLNTSTQNGVQRPVPIPFQHPTSVAHILGLRQQASEALQANPKAHSVSVSGNFGIKSTPEAQYNSVFVRLFDNDNTNGQNKVKARFELPKGVTLVGIIQDDNSAIPNTKAGDTLFSTDPALATALNKASSRRFEPNQDTYTFVDARTLDISLLVTNGADDLRLILDYGAAPAANLAMQITLDPAGTTEPGIIVGTDDQEVMSRSVPLTDDQGQVIHDANRTLVTPKEDVDLIVFREGSAAASKVQTYVTANTHPSEPTPEPTPTASPTPSSEPTPEPTPTATPTASPTASPTAQPNLCDTRSISAQRPGVPTSLLHENFAGQNNPQFADDPSNAFANWVQWGADYYTEVGGVQVHNPGPTLGDRDLYQEYTQERPNLLESGIFKRISLVDEQGNFLYQPGDKIVAKFDVDPRFTHPHSDSDIGLILYNSCTGDATAAYGRPVRGPQAKAHQIYVEIEIPAGMTELAVSLLGYLGYEEAGTVIFEKVSVEQIPQNYYTRTPLYSDNVDTLTSDTHGPNSPAMDGEFGYDFYVVEANTGSADKAVTAYNNNATQGDIGGLVKRVELPEYGPNDRLSAAMYTASTFSSADSFAQLKLEFYNAQDEKLGEAHSTTLTSFHYEYLNIDRAEIPAGSAYVKFVPLVSLGAGETSSLLMDHFSVDLVQP